MESNLSELSSLKEDEAPPYIQPHYRESYRLAIYALLCGGKEAYEEFLRAEQLSHLLSDDEIWFILDNAEVPLVEEESEAKQPRPPDTLSPSTYFPTESDEEIPDLDLGWPEVTLDDTDTSISLLFHPPRENTPTIKEVVRKQIQEARQLVAIAMDVFTDVDIFKEVVSATLRGVVVYILLDRSHYRSFRAMAQRVGVNIQDLKNIRVRTVSGPQYQCQSAVKFHGTLQQKFMMVDCRTVLYGTYSYTWSFEKINLSMVLVITGQLVCSYDEEFRRLYARSTVPGVVSKDRPSLRCLADAMNLPSPNSSQLSLHQIHMRSKVMHGMRSAQDGGFSNQGALTRGLSVQDRLHQSHVPEMGTLVRGHSYGGELQKLNSLTRMRMGTKDVGAPEKNGQNQRGGADPTLQNRLSHQYNRHRTRYGPDQNLIPFNSETSLHKWKMDTYMTERDAYLDASGAFSPVTSPYSSHTGLNEQQTQAIHSRSRDVKTRLEEMRQKRLSLQEYNNQKQSQESLRSMYSTLDRPKLLASLRGLEARQEPQNGSDPPKEGEPNKDGDKTEQALRDGNRAASYFDIKTLSERKPAQYDWNEPLSRTTSAAELSSKLNDPALKPHLLQGTLGMQHPRTMESLSEIPEEKEGSNTRVNSSDKMAALTEERDGRAAAQLNPLKSTLPPVPESRDAVKESQSSIGKASGSNASRERKKSVPNEAVPRVNASSEAKGEKQREEQAMQRKNSLRMKHHAAAASDERRPAKKDPVKPSGPSPQLRADSLAPPAVKQPAVEHAPKKGQSSSKSQNSPSAEGERHKSSPFALHRLSPQRSSKKKANPAPEQERGSRSTLDEEAITVHQTRREKAYSRYELLLSSTENVSANKASRTAQPSEKEKSASLSRHDPNYSGSHSGTEKKLGRLMQRVGSFIHKNK
ncbi:uncharacterized protein ACB057_010726 [Neosynchiropus ocellatus]